MNLKTNSDHINVPVKEYLFKTFHFSGATKTLMFFEGCAFPQLGCTILLRGASEVELKKLKKVTNAVAFMKYNAKLEKSFLLDEFAEPPTVPVFTFIGDTTSPKRNALPIVAQITAKQAVPSSAKESKRTAGESTKKDTPRSEDKRVSSKSVVPVDDDPLHLAASRPDDESHSNDDAPEELSFAEVPMKRNKFKAALRDTVLSFSPFIQVRAMRFSLLSDTANFYYTYSL